MFTTQLSWRYATGLFDGSTLAQEKVDTILEAIRMSPSSFGLMPYQVQVITDKALRAKLKEAAWQQPQIDSASHLLVFCARTDYDKLLNDHVADMATASGKSAADFKDYEAMVKGAVSRLNKETGPLSWASLQAYIGLGFGLAAAAELGVDSCPMEGFDPAAFKTLLGLPAHITPVVLLALGTRASIDQPRPKVRPTKETLFVMR